MGLSAAIKSHPVFLSLLSVVLLPAFNVCLSLIVPEGLGKADTDRDANLGAGCRKEKFCHLSQRCSL